MNMQGHERAELERIVLGDNIVCTESSSERIVTKLNSEDGEGRMIMRPVFDGVYILFNDFTMSRCESRLKIDSDLFCIDHCREGRIEHTLGSGVYSYISAGDMRIDNRRTHYTDFYMPLSHYRGMTLAFFPEIAERSIAEAFPGFPVRIEKLYSKYCLSGTPFVVRAQPQIEHIFSEIYAVPRKIEEYYYRIKIFELLLYLDALEISDCDQTRPYFYKSQVEKVKAIQSLITENYDRHFTLEQLSSDFDMPLTSMKNCFKGVFGTSIYSYIRKSRMNKGRRDAEDYRFFSCQDCRRRRLRQPEQICSGLQGYDETVSYRISKIFCLNGAFPSSRSGGAFHIRGSFIYIYKEKLMDKKNWVSLILSHASDCRGRMIASVICAVIGVFSGIVPYFSVYRIIRLFIDGTPFFEDILFWSLIALAGYAAKQLFNMVSTILSHISAYTILENIRRRIIGRLMNAPLGTVLNDTAGRIKNTIVDKVEEIEIPLAHVIPELFSNMLLPIAVFVYLCLVDWRMALITLVTLPVAFVSAGMMMKTYHRKYDSYMKSSDYVNSVIIEYTEGIEVIKAFNQSGASYEKFSNAVGKFRDFTLDWFKSSWPIMNFTLAVLPSSLIGTVPLGVYLYSTGSLSVPDLAICIIMSLGIVAPFLKFTVFINDLKAIQYAVAGADEFLNMEELKDAKQRAGIHSCDIEFSDVGFSYTENPDENVLKQMSFKLEEGSFNALVGPSGGGKSTIARLIARFWDAGSGRITIGGVDIRDIPMDQLMEIVSYVTQDNFLFDCTLMENIRMGNPSAPDEEVFRVAAAAQCDDFIKRLPLGYDTPAGEAGRRLSGGEKQRIAIARAMLKDAPVVILDEATAFTDPENEEKIQKSLSVLTEGKTLLVIAHRLSTIKNADRILLVEDGRIACSGTHEQLLEDCRLYTAMWEAHTAAKKWSAGCSKEAGINV